MAETGKSKNSEAVASIKNEFSKLNDAVGLGFKQADKWVECCNIIINYVKRKAALEEEYGKSLRKLYSDMRPNLLAQHCLPLHFIYMAAIEQDGATAEDRIKMASDLQGACFLQPMRKQLHEHNNTCNCLKEIYIRQSSKLQSAVASLHKAKDFYIRVNQEMERLDDDRMRSNLSSSGMSFSFSDSDRSRRRKSEDGLQQKISDAKDLYMKSVIVANEEIVSKRIVEINIMSQLSKLMIENDVVMKSVTQEFFSIYLRHFCPFIEELKTFIEQCEFYTLGHSFLSGLKQLASSSLPLKSLPEQYVFEPYLRRDMINSTLPTLPRNSRPRIKLENVTELSRHEILSTTIYAVAIATDKHETLRMCKSKGASRSLENSPEPIGIELDKSGQSSSLVDLNIICGKGRRPCDILDQPCQIIKSGGGGGGGGSGSGGSGSGGRKHKFKNTRVPNKCRACETLFCFNGYICTRCNLSCHKKCLQHLTFQCIESLSDPVIGLATTLPIETKPPPLHLARVKAIKACINYIDENGMDVQGIYRISGAKSKSNQLLESLLSERVDSDSISNTEIMHTVASVLKMLLRMSQDMLFTDDVKKELCRIFQNFNHNETVTSETQESIKACLEKLPATNCSILIILFQHLKKLTSFSEVNLMTPSNLSIILGPTLFYDLSDQSADSFLTANQLWRRIVETFILQYEILFGLGSTNQTDACNLSPDVGFVDLKSELLQCSEEKLIHCPGDCPIEKAEEATELSFCDDSTQNLC